MFWLFAVVAAPVFFFLLLWLGVAAYRLYFPDRPAPFEHALARRQAAADHREAVLVGAREIRVKQRRRQAAHADTVYHYAGWSRGSVPTGWVEDVYRRRN